MAQSRMSGLVSCENKGAVILIPKLDVAGSIPVARSIFGPFQATVVDDLLLIAR